MKYTSTNTKTVEAIQYTGKNEDEIVAWLNAHDKKKRTWRIRGKWSNTSENLGLIEFVAKPASKNVTHLVQKLLYMTDYFVDRSQIIIEMSQARFNVNYPNAIKEEN